MTPAMSRSGTDGPAPAGSLNSFGLGPTEGVDLVGGQQALGDAPSEVVCVGFGESHPELEAGGGEDAGKGGD
jgi:hypothetical protein